MYSKLHTLSSNNFIKQYVSSLGGSCETDWAQERKLDYLNGLLLRDPQSPFVITSDDNKCLTVVDGKARMRVLFDAFVADKQTYAYDVVRQRVVVFTDEPTQMIVASLINLTEFLCYERAFQRMIDEGELDAWCLDDVHDKAVRTLYDVHNTPVTIVEGATDRELQRMQRVLNTGRSVATA